ncbi:MULTISPECIES: SPOR domain-containing protein [unclassified Agrobacterium]|uniref:SPOR domain-containing protein n=1 Tax=unclassified Agrobacterium TaxID=2632611 RepID=UPI00244739A8|nr:MULTISPECIES: SPOR domain-containing protein [unclassified Agrobacterium]MDH0613404.1 SPOR domain-containing protein [Agrobacterium sp. GD03872]MDH0697321.1 SPOR domain-containing protein [Agrobacterium sp. GD03871]MDH1060844.1 SPOR domain-containing protein [Agrobacterium sp. GD03992]MDH2211428.1 SPOR domain-containing protein [Agrobacterium sp. GD03643]MDH2220687.1 SPOR domain-containing protein [Agrobacterium sp. GD03638]
MVEKNVAYNRDARSEGFADNDPLAELARIVGFEDRPSHAGSEAAPRAASPATRREPEFNLEDELLREFEVYDAPHADPVVLDPANDVRAGIHPNDFMQRVESVFARREPELAPVAEPAPVAASAPEVREEPLPEVDQAYIHNYVETTTQDIRADFRDDAGAVAEVFDVHSRQSRPAEPMVYQQAAQQVAWEEPQAAEPVEPEWHTMPELPADVSSNIHAEGHSYAAEPQAFDLADEVEIAVAEEAPAPVSVRPPSHGGRSSLEFSSLRLPLANFGARRDVSAADPRRVGPRSEQQPAAARIEPQVEAAPAVVQAEETAPSFALPVAETFTPAAEPLAFEVAETPAAKHLSPMDELIYDVAKYSIPGRGETPLVQDVPAAQAAKVEPPVVAAASVKAQPIAAAAPAAPAEELDFTDFAGFNDDDFELALDDLDLDLDLSEIAEAEVVPAPQPVRPQPAAPVAVAAAAPQPVRVQPAPQPRPAPVAAATPVAAVPAQPRPAVAGPQPVAPQTLESLPFDPSQIGETEEHPETIVEMDVPELPVGVFEPKPAARRHEEDLDIDTELATLFAPAVAGGLDRHKHAENRGAAQARPVQAPEEADEFERALEEDFRRSMQEAAASRGNASRDAENTYVDHQAAYRDEDERGGRRWIMPVAAAIGLVLIGGGVYALVSGGSSSTGSNGAPVIISADNDPMKVAPENPGGRVVPNQDKAVYDRVAGGSAADPKQPALISSNEQPVDVVQRTLIPEQLPLEGENDADMEAAGTPVGETEDPRLLSPEEKAAQNEGSAATGVSPRKVRTMIVKPDGTLVAQEVEVPAAQPPKADKVAELAAPQTAKPGEGAPAVIAASRVPVAPEQAQPQANTPAATTPAAQSAAPVPAARPSSQPANVVATVTNQGNVRPATAPAQPQAAQQQTAAATPAATSTPSAGGYYIQIASLPSQAEAQKSYQNMSAKFGSVIGGRGVDIKAAEIAGKGTFYRVRIPAGDKNEAVALCEKFRSAGGSCLVAR